MDVIVCLKQTFDTAAKISLTADGKIDAKGIKGIINPYDEYALEEAVRIKEKNGGSVTVISLGGEQAKEALRSALALGADEAILVEADESVWLDELMVAEGLVSVIRNLPCDLVIAGRVSADNGASQVPTRMAERLDVPVVNSVMKLEIEGYRIRAVRDYDGGRMTIETPLPAVVTVQKGINEPRFASMPAIMRARKKEIKTVASPSPKEGGMTLVSYELPPERLTGRILAGSPDEAAKQLVAALKEEAKVL